MSTVATHSWHKGSELSLAVAAVACFISRRSEAGLGMYQLNQKPDTLAGVVTVKESGA